MGNALLKLFQRNPPPRYCMADLDIFYNTFIYTAYKDSYEHALFRSPCDMNVSCNLVMYLNDMLVPYLG